MARVAVQILLLSVTAIALVASCAGRQRASKRPVTGTCVGACDYYLSCKSLDNQDIYQACIAECSDAFGESPQALRELERLECEELTAFIEGPGGRPPGH